MRGKLKTLVDGSWAVTEGRPISEPPFDRLPSRPSFFDAVYFECAYIAETIPPSCLLRLYCVEAAFLEAAVLQIKTFVAEGSL